MISFLNKLKTVRAGDLLSDTVTAARINAIQDAIKALARCENIHSGDGLLMRRGANGVTLQTNIQDSADEAASEVVFQYLPRDLQMALEQIGSPGGGLRSIKGQGINIPFSNNNANLAESILDPKNLVEDVRCIQLRGRRGLVMPEGGKYFEFLIPGCYEIEVSTTTMLMMDDDDPRRNYQNLTIAKWASIGDFGQVGQCRDNVPPQSIVWEALTPSNRIPNDYLAHVNTTFYEHNSVPHCINNDALIQPYFCGPYTIDGYKREGSAFYHYVPNYSANYSHTTCEPTEYDCIDPLVISIPTFSIPVTVTDSCLDYSDSQCCCEVNIDPVTIDDFTVEIPMPYTDCPPPEISGASACDVLPDKDEQQDPGVITSTGTSKFFVEVTPVPDTERTGDYWGIDPQNLLLRYEKDGEVMRELPNSICFWGQVAHQEWQSVEHPTEDPRWTRVEPTMINFKVQARRVGHIEDITNIDRPADLPGDLSEKRKKDDEHTTS